jgi:hypothetical protein
MGYRFIGRDTWDYLSGGLSSAGDVSGDGLDDLLIGVPGGDRGGYNSGEVYLVDAADLASADAQDGATDGVINFDYLNTAGFGDASYEFFGTASTDYLGDGLTTLGDINNDGFADFVLGAFQSDGMVGGNSGQTYLISGADLAEADAADGVADKIVSMNFFTDPDFDRTGAMSYRFGGLAMGDYAGHVSSAGDVDGDGQADLIIGAWEADGGGGNSGEAYIVSTADLAAADAADGNADGAIHLGFITDPDFDRTGSSSYRIVGEAAGDKLGLSVSSAGDVDGDGQADLIVGAFQSDEGGDASGAAYLIASADLADADAADGTADGVIDLSFIDAPGFDRSGAASYQFTGGAIGDQAGRSVAAAGDIDQDGLGDLFIGAITADSGGNNSGEVYLVSGADLAAADAADGTADGVIDLGFIADPDFDRTDAGSYRFTGESAGDEAGISIASVGDVNKDGIPDLIIGAHFADAGGNNSGAAYLIDGADLAAADAADGAIDGVIDLGFITDPDFDRPGSISTKFAGQGSDETGFAVAAAGDVDGDGRADILLSATRAGGGGAGSGGAYLIFGRDINALDAADGTDDGVISLVNASMQLCFAEGVEIATPGGPVPVERLSLGDLVATWEGSPQPVRWLGRLAYSAADLAANPKRCPIRIPAGALGHKQPVRDLHVSRQHRMLIEGKKAMRRYGCAQKLLPAKDLIGWRGIELCPPRPVTYWHVALDPYAMLIANGTPAESFWPGPEALKTLTPTQQIALTTACAGLMAQAARRAAKTPMHRLETPIA